MKTDFLVIGGGVVGASIFNKLTRIGQKVVLIDKASDVATGASKANSGIVHAGYDPEPNSLKAKLNVAGSKMFPKLCKRLGVPLKNVGALVVGDDYDAIKALYMRGQVNKVEGLKILDRDEIRKLVPNISDNISVALYAQTSSIVSPYLLTITLTEEGILNGGKVFLEEDIESLTTTPQGYILKTAKNEYETKHIINCAGAGYNDVAKILGTEEYEITYRRGEYFVFSKTSTTRVPCTIFPMPTAVGKGVLITPTVDGNFLVGPTGQDSDDTTKTTDDGLNEIRAKAGLILKDINFKNSIREFSGIRTICGDDFIIEKSKLKKDIINIAGICSPGLTSAPAIAGYVCRLLKLPLKEKKGLKHIVPYKMLKDYPIEKQNKMIAKDANYGKIVCKCEKITKGDIIFALNRPLKVSTVDGIKRRTNAGMGMCQGGFCFTRVVETIAKQRKIKFEEVKKENRGSEVAVGDIRDERN